MIIKVEQLCNDCIHTRVCKNKSLYLEKIQELNKISETIEGLFDITLHCYDYKKQEENFLIRELL